MGPGLGRDLGRPRLGKVREGSSGARAVGNPKPCEGLRDSPPAGVKFPSLASGEAQRWMHQVQTLKGSAVGSAQPSRSGR